ncbi:putative membrane protein YdbT with pleckstrin-like domain [Microbacterium endophyticum]|uniref:Putative membrane protein YdbT with pleckstrin-like domain n=1 Tax=Microbacterium endophyticum TaxID=1526412 RepID=A0A7W4YMD9_9MICO|nr:PH domain-containing protein [Microbacterium endophyticum]MBB2976360.1 putative membrane protein YdbT with pleckstrin-like domain [Microbacterium endophyticum]NIK35241.1 putative membrane protein YdbT with pleckstrin-like domain [Microbacterium endophyticum]
MTQPTTYGGRPLTPAPGAPTPELRVVRVRGHARRLFWAVLILFAVAAATGYFYNNLPDPYENWMLLTAAAVVIFILVLLPFLVWWSHTYTVTTRRVIERSGIVRRKYRELMHVRGYTVTQRRGILQRMWRTGTLTLANGVDDAIVIRNIPGVALVHEALVDQVEVNQILAHRDGQRLGTGDVPSAGPRPALP